MAFVKLTDKAAVDALPDDAYVVVTLAEEDADGTTKQVVRRVPSAALAPRAITLTLPADGWSDSAQTVNDSALETDGYAYIVAPDGDSYSDYTGCVVYADDVTAAGQITFHCSVTPECDLSVSVLKIKVG